MWRRPSRVSLAFVLSFLGLAVACESPRTEPVPVDAPPAESRRIVEVPDLEPRLARLCDALEQQLDTLHVPGIGFALVKDGEVLLARGFGCADLETRRPVDEETLFAIGSSTKGFTATLVGMLVDEGKLGWDDPIRRYLPYYDPAVQSDDPSAEVTLRDALSHRSGLSRNDVLWAAGLAPRETVLRAAARAEPMAAFRKEFHYNNVMFVAAGEVAATVAGKSWDELAHERILAPLGMRASNTSVRLAGQDPRLALGYYWDEEKQGFEHVPMRNIDSVAAAGAINSNARDMAQWLRFLLARGVFAGERLISEEQLEATWTPAIEIGAGASYGLGWSLHEWRGEHVVEHGGNVDGFAAEVALLPDSNVGFALLMNVSSSPLQGTSQELVWNALFGEPAAPAPEAPAGEVSAPSSASPSEGFEPYLGTYVGNFFQFRDARFEVEVQNERLAVDVPGQMVFELLAPDAEGKRAFALVPDQIQVSFERDASGAVVLLKMYQGGLAFELPREGAVFPIEVPLEELEPYLGAYQEVGDKTIQVVIQNQHLALDYPGQTVYELRPPDDAGLWSFRMTQELGVEFHRGDDGRVESLTFHERGTERFCPRIDVPGLEKPPTLEEILALRRAQEFEERLLALGGCRMRGTVRFVHAGAEGTVASTFQGTDRARDDVDLSPFGEEHAVLDGARAWSKSSFEPFRELEGKFLDEQRIAHPAALFGDWRKHFDSAQVIRTTLAAGRRQCVVQLRKGELEPLLLFVDAETGDVVKTEGHALARGIGSLSRTTTFEDWREVAGVRLPFRMITEDEATGRIVVQMESFESGLELPPDTFVLRPE